MKQEHLETDFFFVKMKGLVLIVSSACGGGLEGGWGLGMD